MQSLSAKSVIRIWELGQNKHPIDRALLMLRFACPKKSLEELVSLTVGQRDAHLLKLRELTLGSQLNGSASCPHCQERLEFDFQVADILLVDPTQVVEQEYSLTAEGFDLRFRLPNSQDLASIVGCRDSQEAKALLIQRCLLEASCEAQPLVYQELPPKAIAKLTEQMTEYDPQAEIQLALDCPACEHSWIAWFDIVDFFWTELTAQAKRLLQEVHLLARFYGWRESDILSMSAVRRQSYLEMLS